MNEATRLKIKLSAIARRLRLKQEAAKAQQPEGAKISDALPVPLPLADPTPAPPTEPPKEVTPAVLDLTSNAPKEAVVFRADRIRFSNQLVQDGSRHTQPAPPALPEGASPIPATIKLKFSQTRHAPEVVSDTGAKPVTFEIPYTAQLVAIPPTMRLQPEGPEVIPAEEAKKKQAEQRPPVIYDGGKTPAASIAKTHPSRSHAEGYEGVDKLPNPHAPSSDPRLKMPGGAKVTEFE